MEDPDAAPNTGRWVAGLATLGALLAGAIQGVLGYYTVTGISFDWLEWDKHPTIASDLAALDLGLSTLLVTLTVASGLGALAWFLIKRGKIRGDPEAREPGDTRSWSEFSFVQVATGATVGALFAAVIAFVGAELLSGGELAGPQFWLTKLVAGVLVVGLTTATLVRALAEKAARDELVVGDPRGNVISRIQLWSSENAVTVVVIVTLVTAATGYGITMIDTDVDVADVLPRGNGNTTAAKNLSSEFQSTFTQQVTLQIDKNPSQCLKDSQRELPNRPPGSVDCGNITDEVYIRAMDEMFRHIRDNPETPVEYNIAPSSFYKLINWTIEGGQDAPRTAFALPATDEEGAQRYESVNETVWASIPGSVTATIDPSFDQAASLFLVPSDSEASSQEIGRSMLEARDDYVEAVENGETKYTVWDEDNPPLFTVDVPVANAHQAELAEEDFTTLFPLVFGFIVVALYFSFRNFTAIGIAGATLVSSTAITYGAMGYIGIPLNTLNLTVLPLILGTGIDFAIHQVTEFAHHKREGLSDEEALRTSGGYAGFAMFIAAVTSISGLLVMTVSPSLLMAQLGLLAAIAIATVYLLTITFMPALLTLAKSSDDMGQKFEASGIVTALTRGFSENRLLVGAMLVLLTAGAIVGTQQLTIEEFGEPAQNFPEDDPLRQEHEEGIRGFYDLDEEDGEELKTNVIVFQGDNSDLQAHRYIEAAQDEMSEKDNLRMSTSRNLPFLMRTWMTVKDGGIGAAEQIGRDSASNCQLPTGNGLPCESNERADNYPQTREEIEANLDAMFNSPLDTFASLFVAEPQYNISTMTLATTTGDFNDAEAAWDDVWTSMDAVEDQRPNDLEPAFVGNTALNYLFITEELPWLSYLGIVSGLVLAFLTAIFTKNTRATAAVMTTMGLTGIWWLGVLPAFDIGLAITLMLPAVFITSIGADYAIHMAWNLIKNPDREEVYGVVGKAVLFSAITDIGAFAIFTQTQNVAASEAMVATVLAIAVMFVVTIMTMPLFYPNEPAEADEPETREAPAPSPAPGQGKVVEAN